MSVDITKLTGGGESWYYAMKDGKVLGAAHEDDEAAMKRLREIKKEEENG